MKNLFFVSVAIGIFSGTSLKAKAQPFVNTDKFSAAASINNSPKFIDGIELNSANNVGLKPVPVVKSPKVLANSESVIEKCSSLQFKYALLLDTDVEDITNIGLYEEIEKWWQTRYRYGGTGDRGIDCSAYTGTLMTHAYGISVARTARAQYAETERIEKEDLREGDLVFFNTGRGVSHVGMYLRNGYFTHSGSSTGVTVSNLSEAYWSRKFLSGGRLPVDSIFVVTEEKADN